MSMISEQVRRLREFAKTLKYADEYNLVNGAADTIEELSAKLHKSQMERSNKYYNGGWIPVSERLPEVGSEVLVCFDFKGKRSVYISHFYGDGEFHGLDDEYLTTEGRKYRKAVAWMPLPQPYLPDINIGNMSEIPTGQIVANGELYPGEFDDPLAEEGSDKE